MVKNRLDIELVSRGLVSTRSQAESYIKLGKVFVNNKLTIKPSYFVAAKDEIKITQQEMFVSRAGLKLASVANIFKLNFKNKIVLDVGSSTGGFTDYSLRSGADKVIAVDVGTDQLHLTLKGNYKIELYEQTNILDVIIKGQKPRLPNTKFQTLNTTPDIILIDVSFVSLREILPHIATLCSKKTLVAAMLKPQFEAGIDSKHKGVIKNDAMRREIMKDFETWVKKYFVITQKADSEVAGTKGNRERFYLLHI
jgi:23S rRNA (cytidine1920-2'-O)/16S rRNA (cytidine1409-2'-O)-methyltransferase